MIEDYRKEFWLPGIDFMSFPTYAISKSGRLVNFESMIYPSPKSAKKFTRRKQLIKRSTQARMFDMLIRIGYFSGLGDVITEMPVILENSKRVDGLDKGLFVLLDYYFPSLHLAVELDSSLHNAVKDAARDKYLEEAHGISTFRIRDLQLPKTQETRFHEFTALLKSLPVDPNPSPLRMKDDLGEYLRKKGL